MWAHQLAMWDSGVSASGTWHLEGVWVLWTWLTCQCAPEAFLNTLVSWFTGLLPASVKIRAGLTQKAGCRSDQ